MEVCQVNVEKGETETKTKFEPITIFQKHIKYALNIEAEEDKITFSINDKEQLPSINYIRTMNLTEIKILNEIFNVIDSFDDFYDYLIRLSNYNKLSIKKDNDKIVLILYTEVLLKQNVIEIDLFQKNKGTNSNIKEIPNQNDKINDIWNIKKENSNLNEKINDIIIEIDKIKSENKKLNNEINDLTMNNKKLDTEIKFYKMKIKILNIKSKNKKRK